MAVYENGLSGKIIILTWMRLQLSVQVYYDIFAALPRLDNVIVLSSASRTSLTIRFPAWSPSNGGGETPAGYEIQWRLNDNSTWIPSTQLQHNGETEYSAVLKGLAPDTLYHVNIIPYIEDDGVRYNGFAAKGGPFRTLRYGKWPVLQI